MVKPLLEKPPEPESDQPPREESAAWRSIRGIWKPLHGSFKHTGLSVEWHDFHVDNDVDWSRSFHLNSLEICLNFSGTGTLQDGNVARTLEANHLAIYTTQSKRVRATRHAGSLHRFLTLELTPDFFAKHLSTTFPRLKPEIRRFAEQTTPNPPFLEIKAMPAGLLSSRVHFVDPPVPAPARDTWYLGRVLEILAQTVFPDEDPAELFCHKHQRTNRERIERARYLIERDLENPPSLQMLADEVGCSPFYLSRTFAQESGVSIPKYLRMKRVEKAAELIQSGRMNVTEAAMTVGYSSLSAFNKAFVEQMKCCPGLYPILKIAGR